MPPRARAAGIVVAEAVTIGFFALLAWAGWKVLMVLEGMSLVSLTWCPVQLTQSVIPIGAGLFILASLLSLPDYWRETMAGRSFEHPEIVHEATPSRGGDRSHDVLADLRRAGRDDPDQRAHRGRRSPSAASSASLVAEGAASLVTIALDMYSGATKFSLIAIPMFVLAGAIMNAGGITRRLIEFVSALIGFVRGGLAMVNVGVSLFFAEISGSAVADVAAIGSVMIPEMKKRGYSAPFAAAVTSSAASLAIIIPPSIPMILYGVTAGVSIEQLFLAGLVPGLIGGPG